MSVETSPHWSVVVPLYRGRRFIDETLESVAACTDPPPQVVVVDDCCPEKSGEYVASRYPDTVVVQNASNLCGRARHVGLAAVTAPWVLFLDQDDLLVASGVRNLLALARGNPAAVAVVGQFSRFTEGPRPTPAWIERDRYWPDAAERWRLASLEIHMRMHQLGSWLIRTACARAMTGDPALESAVAAMRHHDYAFVAALTTFGDVWRSPAHVLRYRTQEKAALVAQEEAADSGPTVSLSAALTPRLVAQHGAARFAVFERLMRDLHRADSQHRKALYWRAFGSYLRAAARSPSGLALSRCAQTAVGVGMASSLRRALSSS